jgi:hypothetical protein
MKTVPLLRFTHRQTIKGKIQNVPVKTPVNMMLQPFLPEKKRVGSFFLCYQHAASTGFENNKHFLECRRHGISVEISRTRLFFIFFKPRGALTKNPQLPAAH